jgi:hypothetical protein
MTRNEKLRLEVRDLYNEIFPWEIDPEERNISDAVISGFGKLYRESHCEIAASIILRLHFMPKIKPARTKLEICKRLLLGDSVQLLSFGYVLNIREIYSDFVPGKKIHIILKND